MTLVNDVIAAHDPQGRRASFMMIEADISTGGGLFPLKGLQTDTATRPMTVWLRELRASVAPFGADDQRSAFTTGRTAIEKLDGRVVLESLTPSSMFVGHGINTPWGSLHRAYFNGYALWTYLNTPFLLNMPGVVVEQLPDWQDEGETWKVQRVVPRRNVHAQRAPRILFWP